MTSADSSDRPAETVAEDAPDQEQRAVLNRDLLDRKVLQHLEEKAREQLAVIRDAYEVRLTGRRDRCEEVLREIAARDWHDRHRGLEEIVGEQQAWADLLAEHQAAVGRAANDLLPEQAAAQIADYRDAAEDPRAALRRAERQLVLAERIEHGHLSRIARFGGAGAGQAERAIATKTARKVAEALAAVIAADEAAAGRMTAKVMEACADVAALDNSDLAGLNPLAVVTGGVVSLDLGTGLADCDRRGATARPRRVDMTEDTGHPVPATPATGLVIIGSARDVAAATRTRHLGGDLLLSYARRAAWEAAYDGVPSSVKPAMDQIKGLEIVVLADPAIGGGLWVEIDPATQEPAVTLLVDLQITDGELDDFRLLLPGRL